MAEKTKYSIKWARNVALRFEESYSRATDFYKRLYQIDTDNLAAYIARSDPFWVVFKNDCKVLHRVHPDGRYEGLDTVLAANLKAFKERKNRSEMDKRLLTRLEKLVMLKELDMRKGSGAVGKGTPGPKAPEPSLFLPYSTLEPGQLMLNFDC